MPNPPDPQKIAQKAKLLPIEKVAAKIGIKVKYIESYGRYKAKISVDILKSLNSKKNGKYILVTSTTPTPTGEGKTVITIGLSMALNKLGKKSVACIRQPALGPIFGSKGCSSGGGHSQVVPLTDINLHLTGDSYAVAAAHNLCATYLDNSLYNGNPLDINPNRIMWDRVSVVNDRFLRNISIGMGSKSDGITRRSSFSIAEASELMAILSFSESIAELRKRISKIIVAFTKKGKPVTAEDINAAGPMTVLVRNALNPNLLQTLEGTPCFIHTGSFADIACGSSSVIADKMALKLSEYTITESGFGADMGAEKFANIKCRISTLKPDAVVLVMTIRGLKIHSGDFEVKGGRQYESLIYRENISAIERGASNLAKQIDNIKCYGVPLVVCINRFQTDTEKEIQAVKRSAMSSGADACVTSEVWQKGSIGGQDLAKTVIELAKNKKSSFRFLYPLDMSLKDKIGRIAKTMYGAKEVVYSEDAQQEMKALKGLKFFKLPICMAKTRSSLSHDPKRKGRPRNFKLPINSIQVFAGAGYVHVSCGDIKTMPALPKKPYGRHIDIDKQGNITGLF